MKTIRMFFDAAEAGFASSLLEAGGIQTLLHGEQSVPVTPGFAAGGIRLQVADEDVERALVLLREGFDAADDRSDSAPDVSAPVAPVAEEESEAEAEPAGGRLGGGKTPVLVFVLAVVALGLLSFALHQWSEKRQAERGSHPGDADLDEDGRPDHFFVYRDGWLRTMEVDRNGDGAVDEWITYDFKGRTEHSEADDNFDTRPDAWFVYHHAKLQSWKRDTDFDGVPDEFGTFKNGVAAQFEVRPGDSKIVSRRSVLAHGVVREELFDQDRDGKFDFKILYDEFGNPSERMPIVPAK